MVVYSTMPSQEDMTAAWYAAAPPPPPPQQDDGYVQHGHPVAHKRHSMMEPGSITAVPSTLATRSSSTHLGFDRSRAGDDLPSDTHAPAPPERPVSRSAVARQKEKQRQRARTNSTSHYGPTTYDQPGQQPMAHSVLAPAVGVIERSPSPGLQHRIRCESSPAPSAAYPLSHDHIQPQQSSTAAWHTQATAPTAIHPYDGQPPQSPIQQQMYANAYNVVPPVSQTYASPSTAWATQTMVPTTSSPGQSYYVQPHPTAAVPPVSHYEVSHGQPSYAVPVSVPMGYYSAPQTPAHLPHGHWPHPSGHQPILVTEPMSLPQTPLYASQPMIPIQPISQPSSWTAPPAVAAVPFPSSSMPPPPVPVTHVGTVPSVASVLPMAPPPIPSSPTKASQARPLPLPSRASSQSSSHDAPSSPAHGLGSSSGTIRRGLPQPPVPQRSESNPHRSSPMVGASTSHTVRHSTDPTGVPARLDRHESVRMAAEEIMARGLPNRRKRGVPSSIPVSTTPMPRPAPSTTPSRNTGTSADELVQGLEAMTIRGKKQPSPRPSVQPSTASTVSSASDTVHAPSQPPMRAASPRPIRAAPPPAPAVVIDEPLDHILPRRPLSRGPKDDRERSRSQERQRQVQETSYAVPTFSFDGPDDSPPRDTVPSIVLPHSTPTVPSIGITAADEEDEDEQQARPQGSSGISISLSSSGLAQHSTSSMTSQAPSHPSADASQRRQRMASRGPLVIAHDTPASASSVGSGASCAACQRWVGGRVVHAMNHAFHPDCFVCVHCNEALEHVAFYEHEGQPYCHFDYHELFSKRCFHCRTPIVDQRFITINDPELVGNDGTGQQQERCYHELHFFCANCGDPFLDPKSISPDTASMPAGDEVLNQEDNGTTVRFEGSKEFVVHKGYPYCEPCHVSLHKPRCRGCQLPIRDAEFLTALRAKWHVGCFACHRCRGAIESDNFFVRDGHAYDEECYKVMLRSEL